MSESLYSGKIAYRLLFVQLMTFVLIGAAFGLKGLAWSALAGGFAAWLPNAMFMLFALRYQAQAPVSSKVAWWLAGCEGLKIVITIVLLIIALAVFKAVFVPLSVTYLAVLLVQILAPAVINHYRT